MKVRAMIFTLFILAWMAVAHSGVGEVTAAESASFLSNDPVQSETTFVWFGTWSYATLTLYTYSSGNVIEQLDREWNMGEQNWVNSTRNGMSYDGSNRLVSDTAQTWDTDHWVNASLTTYVYSGGGNELSETIYQVWQGSAWVNSMRSVPTYSGGRIVSSTSQTWSGSAWVNSNLQTFTYDGSGHLTEMLTQQYSGQTLINLFKSEFDYDGSGNQVLQVNSQWESSAWSVFDSDTSKYASGLLMERVHFVNLSSSLTRTNYSYDGNENLVEEISQSAFGPDTWFNTSRTVYVYQVSGIFDDEGLTAGPENYFVGQNYPNPFNLGTVLPYALDLDGHVRISVCNVLGQMVAVVTDQFQTAGSHTAYWEGRNASGAEVPSGVYFFRVQVGSQSSVRKMVLLK